MSNEQRTHESGFTLVEIMVVVVILGLLATLVVQNVIQHVDEARVAKARQDVETIAEAVKTWRIKNGALPDGLEALNRKDENGSAYLDRMPRDPWDDDYILIPDARGTQFVVLSMGPDKRQDTGDDIRYPKDETR